jgi:hypothetical protein
MNRIDFSDSRGIFATPKTSLVMSVMFVTTNY